MLDTVVGTPMGAMRASAGGAGSFLLSSRYVLKQTCTIKNISGGALSNVQLFQFLHGLNSQRGVYDNRTYPAPFSNFQYDMTLAGVDPYAAGTNSSSAGLEDYLGFHASVAPSAFEIGYYGIEGNGLDDHAIGKPSDGVHLSIENNWLTAPYSTRQGTDEFAPAATLGFRRGAMESRRTCGGPVGQSRCAPQPPHRHASDDRHEQLGRTATAVRACPAVWITNLKLSKAKARASRITRKPTKPKSPSASRAASLSRSRS